VYWLGQNERGPLVGSIITGVGIGVGDGCVELIKVHAAGHPTILGRFALP
jgi:hypothetical protein